MKKRIYFKKNGKLKLPSEVLLYISGSEFRTYFADYRRSTTLNPGNSALFQVN
jgi:hypothetical protein